MDLLLQGQNVPLQKRKIINEGNNIVHCEIITNQKEPQNLSESYYKKSNIEKRQKDNYLLKKITKNEDWKAKSIGKPALSLKKKLGK